MENPNVSVAAIGSFTRLLAASRLKLLSLWFALSPYSMWLFLSARSPNLLALFYQDTEIFTCVTLCVAHLSLDRGLGSGRRTIRGFPARVAGGDMGKLVSREPDFLCRGSSPMAPAISLSMGQEPARPCDAIGHEPERAWW